MLLWLAIALVTAAVVAWVLAPLAQPTPAGDSAGSIEAGTRAVYRDQLAEIEAEHAAGLIGVAEVEAARLEISRRLLASAARSESAEPSAAPREASHTHLLLGTAIAVPLLALGLYLMHGSPGLSSSPFVARVDAARGRAELVRLITKVEERLREAPEDGKAWEVVAPVYLKLGRFRDAATAYANAARIQGETANLLAGLAEASLLASNGIVTEKARTAYEKVLKLEPGRVDARFWLATAKEQDGRLADALAGYRALLKAAPPEAAYRAPLELRIREVSKRMANAADAKKPGPTAVDIETASKLSAEERIQMISAMVEGLARRLKENGKDLPGWRRLINAYAVLGRKDDARAVLAEARRNFDGDALSLSELSRLAASLGLGS